MHLSVREHISGTAGPIFTKFGVQISCGRGSVLLCRCYAALCTSGFMADVTFGRNGPYGDGGVAILGRSLMSMNALFLTALRFELSDACLAPVSYTHLTLPTNREV